MRAERAFRAYASWQADQRKDVSLPKFFWWSESLSVYMMAAAFLGSVSRSSGTPGRTRLSTNGTCQLEKTENAARKWPSGGGRRASPTASCSLSGRLRKPQHIQNVSDTGV